MSMPESGRSTRLLPWLRLLASCVFVFFCGMSLLSGKSSVHATQDEHVTIPQSRYETGATARNAYVGETKCVTCHEDMNSALTTPMGLAAQDPRSPDALDYSTMRYRDGPYTVTIAKDAGGLEMKASDGSADKAAPIRWIFGQGYDGQTFILEKDGKLYESRASYYVALSNLDLTIGHSRSLPASITAALGRPLPEAEVQKCFSCHTSQNVFDGRIDVKQAHPGVTCEKCHGAGSEHVARIAEAGDSNKLKDVDIFNPGLLAPADLNDFCGNCHRTTRDVLSSGIRDIRNIRFQPYRLENSRCYDPSDSRITCIACHDPHKKLEIASAAYDGKCLSCHVRLGEKPGRDQTAAACPRATRDCASCHMPRLDLPGAHFAFTDHYIRVVKPNGPYPN
jgi:hypothetical protein